MRSRLHRTTSILAASLVAVTLACSGCATNPATGKRQISLVSTSKEADMGRESDPAVIEQYNVYGDSAVGHYVDSVGQRLAAVSHLPTLDHGTFASSTRRWSTRSPFPAATSTSREESSPT